MADDKKVAPKFTVDADTKSETKAESKSVEVAAPPNMRDMLRAMMEEMMPMMAAAMQMGMAANRQVDPRAERAAVASGPRCPECKQLQKACGGEHESIVVYPVKYPEFGQWFRGVGINGIWYRSDNAGQLVTVPKVAVGDILQTVINYEENERETRMGRSGGHNFGNVANPVAAPPQAGWR